jgi:HD-GYP domain-containing protein (c-di-GMP phosphodiesterase class II)
LAEEDCERLYLAGLLHDLGKLGVPDVVLKKPGRLSDEEMDQIRPHPERGWAILQDLDQLQNLVPEILHHHERYDGTGYPDGLAGDAIPLMAQVLAVADAYDAMVSNRPYREGMLHKKAESILREGSGSQWNPKVIDTFFRNVSEIRTLWSTHRPQAPRRRRPDKASRNRADPPKHKECESGV